VPIGVKTSDAESQTRCRCRRTVPVCTVLKGAKRGRFVYFALILMPMRSPYRPTISQLLLCETQSIYDPKDEAAQFHIQHSIF
jgi:hypothetical protein